ncbi:MAG: hypothetical protein M0T80_11070 [Actinomycetota bacterium]|nr:hypothetical protein [Actinomycetota bacterium]
MPGSRRLQVLGCVGRGVTLVALGALLLVVGRAAGPASGSSAAR